MYPARTLSVERPWNNGGPRSLPAPVRGNVNESPISIKEVKGGGVGKLRNNEGTVKAGEFGISTGFGGLGEGGINVIIVGVARAVEDG